MRRALVVLSRIPKSWQRFSMLTLQPLQAMPPPNASDNDESPVKNKRPTNTTPRRSPAVKRPNATPRRKVSANKAGTPNSAPARARPGPKKAEATLLGDFLLGRPSVNKPRRRSLDFVKAEMRQASVNKLQPPGGVKDRVKQWQKASAAAVIEDPLIPASEPDDVLAKAGDESVDEEDRRRIRSRAKATRPGRRKTPEKENPLPDPEQVRSSPKKRVISDSHWMKPRTPEIKLNGGSPLPKDFLKNSPLNPPLEKKIEDWARRTASEERRPPKERHQRSASKSSAVDDGIRVFPSKSPSIDDGIRVTPSKESPYHDGIREKPVRSEGMRKPRLDREHVHEYESPRKRSGKHLRPSSPELDGTQSTRTASSSIRMEEAPPTWTTPSPPYRTRTHRRRSGSQESLAEVPVGYSAFSVLDMPTGADANAMRRPAAKPQRTPSLSAVPKALKKVYNEALGIVHDTVDPPRTGINQPPSIESWLKSTSDPFIDQPDAPESVIGDARPRYERQVFEENKAARHDNDEGTSSRTRNRVRTPQRYKDDSSLMEDIKEDSPGPRDDSKTPGRSALNEVPSPISPTGLKRSPATRISSSPIKSARKIRDALAEAFRGESEPVKSKMIPVKSDNISDMWESVPKQPIMEPKVKPRKQDGDYEHRDLPERPMNPNRHRSESSASVEDAQSTNSTSPQQRSYTRRDTPTTGNNRLSTIASVETFETSSSMTDTSSYLSETASELSQTTVTQTTLTQNTASTSNTSNTGDTMSSISRQHSNPSGLKRRLTKHSDLLSVLSLHNATEPGRSKSIRSARSVRTARSHLATATVPSLLQELADDEVKYMRELKTLVDGEIPVLLTCVLSKSESAVTAGLFDPHSKGSSDGSITKPIVDMGIALERLKSLHKRTPLQDPDHLVHWAVSAHKVYQDYLAAWRMGFQDVIVNLAPASPSDEDQSILNGGMSRNDLGDVLNENGERVDVAFLLKRPLVRIKYLAKILKVSSVFFQYSGPLKISNFALSARQISSAY
jgi:hypothetical protein